MKLSLSLAGQIKWAVSNQHFPNHSDDCPSQRAEHQHIGSATSTLTRIHDWLVALPDYSLMRWPFVLCRTKHIRSVFSSRGVGRNGIVCNNGSRRSTEVWMGHSAGVNARDGIKGTTILHRDGNRCRWDADIRSLHSVDHQWGREYALTAGAAVCPDRIDSRFRMCPGGMTASCVGPVFVTKFHISVLQQTDGRNHSGNNPCIR